MLCSVTHPSINPFKNNLPYIFSMNTFYWMKNCIPIYGLVRLNNNGKRHQIKGKPVF